MKDIRIIMPIGSISSDDDTWQKELNLVSVGNGPIQYDLREWSLDHSSTRDGISFTNDEAVVLLALLKECFKNGEEIDFSKLQERFKPSYKQTILPEMENTETVAMDETKLFAALDENKLEYIDNRPKNGALWVFGGHELDKVMVSCQELGYKFFFSEKGGRTTKGQPGWYLPYKK